MRRILLGQGLAPGVAALLRTEGWDGLHVMEAGLDRAGDFDHDLYAYLVLAQASGPSVVLARLEGLRSGEPADLIRRV
jgi:hypothetical protein